LFRENIMGSSLHNKIPLGRSPILSSRPLQAALVLGVCASIALCWLALRALT
jgi:hypothetical protein